MLISLPVLMTKPLLTKNPSGLRMGAWHCTSTTLLSGISTMHSDATGAGDTPDEAWAALVQLLNRSLGHWQFYDFKPSQDTK